MSHLIENPQPAHHAKCSERCQVKEGLMLKCLNLSDEKKLPCKNLVHAICASIPQEEARFLSIYYCVDCTTSNEELHAAMDEAEQIAKASYKKSKAEAASEASVSLADHNKLKLYATELDKKLQERIELTREQDLQNKALQEKVKSQDDEIQKLLAENKRREKEHSELVERIKLLETNQRPSSSSSAKNFSKTPQNVEELSPNSLFSHFENTIHRAESVDGETSKGPTHNTTISSASTTSTSSRDRMSWPDYSVQADEADKCSEQTLMLVRASLAKPQSFHGDVTRWSTFLSEFLRTSARGHYRDFEDMDRLRDLIQGDAREMFLTELSDPCAEATSTLKRLDDFFGVKGNAVRVSLERVTQMGKIDKSNQREAIVKLYTNVKQYALQCRIHRQEHELSSQATLLILESKMCQDHVTAWRTWTKNNGYSDNVDGVIAFLEEEIRELNFRSTEPPKAAIKAQVHATTDVTGGPEQPESPAAQRGDGHRSASSRGRGRGRGRGGQSSKRYANCPCFLCREKHPFYSCPQFLGETVQKRMEIVTRLKICTRCLCNNSHTIDNCHNKLLRCYEPGCRIERIHPKLHNHPQQQSSSAAVNHIDINDETTVSHFAMVPGHVIGKNGEEIFTTIMWDTGSGISLASEKIFEQAKYESRTEYELTLHWATSVTHTENNAKLFDLYFRPLGRERSIKLEGLTAVSELDLPSQSQNATDLKLIYPHLKDVPLQNYERQKPQILLGLPHNHLTCPITTVQSNESNSPTAILTKLGWFVLGKTRAAGICRPIFDSSFVNFACCEVAEKEISNDQLLRYIHRYNQLESIGITHADAPLLSAEDQRASEMIKETLRFDASAQRFEIGLLWAKKDDTMPDNYHEAVIRLQSTERRLRKLNMVDFVHQQFTQQIAEGLLIEVTREEANRHARRIGKAKSTKGLIKLNDYVVYMDPTKNPSQWSRGVVSRIYPGRDKKVRVADVKLKSGEIIPRRSVYRLAKIDLRLESEAAEQRKYSNALKTLNSSARADFSTSNASESKQNMVGHINCRIFDDSTTGSGRNHQKLADISEEDRNKYIGVGDRSVYVKNLPPALGFSEIFTVMMEFGEITAIIVSKWNGTDPFNAIVCYREPASVNTALLFDESQLVAVGGQAHRQNFTRLAKILNLKSCLKIPLAAFVTFKTEHGTKHRVLTIQEGKQKPGIRDEVPINGNQAGFINYCPRSHRYAFDYVETDISNGAKAFRELPFELKEESTERVNIVAACSRNVQPNEMGTRRVRMENDRLEVRVAVEDPFQPDREAQRRDVQDLRQVIQHRREARRINSILVKQQRKGRGRRP